MDEVVEWPFAPNVAGRFHVTRTKITDQDTVISNGQFEFSTAEVPWPVAKEANLKQHSFETKTLAKTPKSMTITFSPDETVAQTGCACGQGFE